VRIIVNEFDSILRPAMTTKNTIETAVVDNVIFIPIEALFSNDSISYVFLKDGRTIKKQQVIAGQSNENEIIIKAGITADDEVLLNIPEDDEKMTLIPLSKEIIEKYKEKPLPAPVQKPKSDKTVTGKSGIVPKK